MKMLTSVRSLLRPLLGAAALAAAGFAQAQSLCVFDPMGASGDYVSMFKDYQIAAKRWGLNLDLKPYTDDGKLDEDFRSGKCDMASMIGMRARQYNRFTGTLDAPSVIENYAQERDVMSLMASPKVADKMVSGPYEVVGMVPIGAAYAVVNDRNINSLERGAGKRVLVMNWDKTQSMMAEELKVVPVNVDIASMGSFFNKGNADIVVAPLVVYKAMDLSKGVGDKGGIVRRPMFQFTMQLVAHTDKLPAGYGQASREYMNSQTDHAIGIVRNLEASIDNRLWIYAAHSEVMEWNSAMRSTLGHMTAVGYFDQNMLNVLKAIRCHTPVDETNCSGLQDPTASL